MMELPKGWAVASLELLLDYEQPQKYIVDSTEYSESYPTPVLTAGKSFIIRHTNETSGIYEDRLPVIIFDDFTTATQFVTFPFKVKSSAMKMLQTVSPELNIKYLFYRMQLIRHNATTHKRYWISSYSKNVIEFPPLAEQHRIVAKIDALFSKLDKGVETLQAIRQQLWTYRQAVLKWAFEGKDFEKKPMKCLSQAFGGGAFKSGNFLSEGKYQVIKIGNVRPGIIRLQEKPTFMNSTDGCEKYLLQDGDIVITLTGTRKKRDYGFTAIINHTNLLLNQRVAAIRFNCGYLPKFFMYYSWTRAFQDDFFADETGNVGQGNVGMKAITETLIPLCSLEEQATIIAAIESRLSVCDKLESIIDENLAKATALRQSILKKAFAGQLVPQDPDDEAADKLLERIKAAKLAAMPAKKSANTRRKKNG